MTNFFKHTINDVPLSGKTILVRADYNVPLDDKGEIDDDFRIRASLPTIQALLSRGCKVVIMSHLGRPDGKRDMKYSLSPVAHRLSELLEVPVKFIDDCIGDKVRIGVKKAPAKSVILLENLRFYPEEEQNDMNFAKNLAKDSGARYFVQDGFGVVHRAHTSTSAITQYLPSVAGFLLEKEYTAITSAMEHPKHPLVAILGGAKVSDKIPLIKALEPKADTILVGGAMANTILANAGVNMGKSKVESDQGRLLEEVYRDAAIKVGSDKVNDFIVLPKDVAVGSSVDKSARRRSVSINKVGADSFALDIGDQTIEKYIKIIEEAKTVIWNGTMGMAELPEFAHGSARIALALAQRPEITSVIGGGDTADFVLHWDAKEGGSFTHVSTGGGASLELMAGEKLPGVEALLDARR